MHRAFYRNVTFSGIKTLCLWHRDGLSPESRAVAAPCRGCSAVRVHRSVNCARVVVHLLARGSQGSGNVRPVGFRFCVHMRRLGSLLVSLTSRQTQSTWMAQPWRQSHFVWRGGTLTVGEASRVELCEGGDPSCLAHLGVAVEDLLSANDQCFVWYPFL